jgi:hypothetical protein
MTLHEDFAHPVTLETGDRATPEEEQAQFQAFSIRRLQANVPPPSSLMNSAGFASAMRGLDEASQRAAIRNILIPLLPGFRVGSCVKGDNALISAVVCQSEDSLIPIEVVRAGEDLLEGPRRSLESVVVLANRFGVARETISPLIVVESFPRIRSEYYDILEDYEACYGVVLQTASLGMLLAMAVSGSHLAPALAQLSLYARRGRESLADVSRELIRGELLGQLNAHETAPTK